MSRLVEIAKEIGRFEVGIGELDDVFNPDLTGDVRIIKSIDFFLRHLTTALEFVNIYRQAQGDDTPFKFNVVGSWKSVHFFWTSRYTTIL